VKAEPQRTDFFRFGMHFGMRFVATDFDICEEESESASWAGKYESMSLLLYEEIIDMGVWEIMANIFNFNSDALLFFSRN
jgi:hypothetical protein